ncbi:MAG: Hsp20 family protein [Albidovulum sp.]|nr:Hsp20 family protein [Albidovulum sp.]
MRTFDLSPIYRTTVGFDQFADLFNRALSSEVPTNGYPPFNIEKTSPDSYRITVAAAGFASEDLGVEIRQNQLVVKASKPSANEDHKFLHRGIANRSFEKKFQLADYVVVTGASYENGLLNIDLAREIPEALKPRRIEIASAGSGSADAKARGVAADEKVAIAA